ncbi:unnamed protein product [Amaranthus hypochondriacus]
MGDNSNTFKPVQESLLETGGKVPKRYIKENEEEEVIEDIPDLALKNDLIIDLSLLSSAYPNEVEKLRSALSSWGYVHLINHGMSCTFLDQVRDVIKQFFTLPTHLREPYFIKDKQAPTDAPLNGYGSDNAYKQVILNWNDNMHLPLYPPTQQNFEKLPSKPESFRSTLHEYTMKTKMIIDEVLKAMACSLKLEEESFFKLWGNHENDIILGRFNYYPRCPMPDKVDGLKPHGDGSAITIVLQDKYVDGLQILKDDKWFKLPIIPGAVLFIVGDQMEIMSNGIFKSPTHKVVPPSQFDRSSVAMFCIPNPEKEIGPLKGLIDKDRPQLYKYLKDYAQIFFQSYPQNDKDRKIHDVKLSY